jgi:hypothetical protein
MFPRSRGRELFDFPRQLTLRRVLSLASVDTLKKTLVKHVFRYPNYMSPLGTFCASHSLPGLKFWLPQLKIERDFSYLTAIVKQPSKMLTNRNSAKTTNGYYARLSTAGVGFGSYAGQQG